MSRKEVKWNLEVEDGLTQLGWKSPRQLSVDNEYTGSSRLAKLKCINKTEKFYIIRSGVAQAC